MIVGIGTDLCDVQRMESDLRRGDSAIRDEAFTAAEIERCESHVRRAQRSAGGFAAKEALFKDLGVDGREGLLWRQVEVEHEPDGRPRLRLHWTLRDAADRLGVCSVLLSLSHTARIAAAIVVLESKASTAAPPGVTR